jgi:hypothetical protein
LNIVRNSSGYGSGTQSQHLESRSYPQYVGVTLIFADILNLANKATIAAGAMLIAIGIE